MNKVSISKNTLKIIYQYCGDELASQIDREINCWAPNIRIINTGLVSSGKSTLFNALIDNYNAERFLTGAARTTRSQDTELLQDNIYLVDTPGINVNTEDDKLAFETMVSADIIVMLHNIKMGMLNRDEYIWFEKIAACIPDLEERKSRLVFVCTWIDERDQDELYQKTINETKRMVFEIFGTEIDFWQVSAKRYLNGCRKDKEALKKISNIPEFRDFLIHKAKSYEECKYSVKHTEVITKCIQQIVDTLQMKKVELQNQEKEVELKVTKKYESIWKNWCNSVKQLKNMIKEYKKIDKKYHELIEKQGNVFWE